MHFFLKEFYHSSYSFSETESTRDMGSKSELIVLPEEILTLQVLGKKEMLLSYLLAIIIWGDARQRRYIDNLDSGLQVTRTCYYTELICFIRKTFYVIEADVSGLQVKH